MAKLKLMTIIGTRPEIIRLSATIKACDRYFDQILVPKNLLATRNLALAGRGLVPHDDRQRTNQRNRKHDNRAPAFPRDARLRVVADNTLRTYAHLADGRVCARTVGGFNFTLDRAILLGLV